jgi:hypothetical protein
MALQIPFRGWLARIVAVAALAAAVAGGFAAYRGPAVQCRWRPAPTPEGPAVVIIEAAGGKVFFDDARGVRPIPLCPLMGPSPDYAVGVTFDSEACSTTVGSARLIMCLKALKRLRWVSFAGRLDGPGWPVGPADVELQIPSVTVNVVIR